MWVRDDHGCNQIKIHSRMSPMRRPDVYDVFNQPARGCMDEQGIIARRRGRMSNFKKPRKKYKGMSKASIAAEKQKSLSDIEKTRRKLDAIKGRELNSIRESAKDMIEFNIAIQELEKNKALIESTYKGTPGQKASTWTRK